MHSHQTYHNISLTIVYLIEKWQNLHQKEAAEYGIEEFPKLVVFENGIPNLYDGGFTDGQVYKYFHKLICFLFVVLVVGGASLLFFENRIPNLYDGGFTDGQVTFIICFVVLVGGGASLLLFENRIHNLYDGGFADGQVICCSCCWWWCIVVVVV